MRRSVRTYFSADMTMALKKLEMIVFRASEHVTILGGIPTTSSVSV